MWGTKVEDLFLVKIANRMLNLSGYVAAEYSSTLCKCARVYDFRNAEQRLGREHVGKIRVGSQCHTLAGDKSFSALDLNILLKTSVGYR